MQARYKKRITLIAFLSVFVGSAFSLILYALRKNISLYYSPTELLLASHTKKHRSIRLGGFVANHSVVYEPSSIQMHFDITDYHHHIRVNYHGALPNLFREGQGVVVEGVLDKKGEFDATRVLAKHDASYHPPITLSKTNQWSTKHDA